MWDQIAFLFFDVCLSWSPFDGCRAGSFVFLWSVAWLLFGWVYCFFVVFQCSCFRPLLSLCFVSLMCFWWGFVKTVAKFTMPYFDNPFFQKCKPNNFLKSSSILTLMSLYSAFKHVSLLHSDNYK